MIRIYLKGYYIRYNNRWKKQVIFFFFSKELLNDTAIAAKSVGTGGANERAKIIVIQMILKF